MQDHIAEQELKERLSLIERMIAEGRRNNSRTVNPCPSDLFRA
jgi:hypothetical protein